MSNYFGSSCLKTPRETQWYDRFIITIYLLFSLLSTMALCSALSLIIIIGIKWELVVGLIVLGHGSYLLLEPFVKTVILLRKNHGILAELEDLYLDLSLWGRKTGVNKLY